jgi:hypothetical protein
MTVRLYTLLSVTAIHSHTQAGFATEYEHDSLCYMQAHRLDFSENFNGKRVLITIKIGG